MELSSQYNLVRLRKNKDGSTDVHLLTQKDTKLFKAMPAEFVWRELNDSEALGEPTFTLPNIAFWEESNGT